MIWTHREKRGKRWSELRDAGGHLFGTLWQSHGSFSWRVTWHSVHYGHTEREAREFLEARLRQMEAA